MIVEEYYIDDIARWGFMAPVSDEENPLDVAAVVCPSQTHTVNVGELTGLCDTFPETDAIVTRLKGVRIGVRTADCVPIVVYAPDVQAIAAVHAGWKGTLGGILSLAVGRLVDMGASAGSLKVRIGAHICGECYEVDESLASLFREAGYGKSIHYPDVPLNGKERKPHLSLLACHLQVLGQAGVAGENIEVDDICTRHSHHVCDGGAFCRFPSWRREPGTSRRMITWIGMEAEQTNSF